MARIEVEVQTGLFGLRRQTFAVEVGDAQKIEVGDHSIEVSWRDLVWFEGHQPIPWVETSINKGETVSVISHLRCYDGKIRQSGWTSSLTNVRANGIVPGNGGHLALNSTSYKLKAKVKD